MKRILILMLALILCVAALASCNGNVTPTDPATDGSDNATDATEAPLFTPEQALKNAAAYLKNMYKAFLTNSETAADFELVSSVKVSDVDYTIEWTVDNEAVKVEKGEGKVTVNVDEKSATDVEYKLTAVVVAPDGTKSSPVTFKLKVPASNFVTIKEALAAEDGTFVTVSGKVILINTAWDDGYKNISVTIQDEAGDKLYLYRLATKVELGDILMVKGQMATYNNARQLAQGCTANITGHEDVVLDYKKVTIPEALAEKDDTLVEVSGTVKLVGTPWDDGYKNMSVTITDKDGNELYIYRLATKVEQGDIITVKGVMTTYKEKRQIAQGGTAEITGKENITVEYKKVTISEALNEKDGTPVEVSGTVKLINGAWSDQFNNMSVTIVDKDGNELYVYRLSTKVEQGDVITVKGVMDTYNDARQIAQGATATITGKEDVVLEYKKVTIPEALEEADDALIEVSGVVSKIDTAWSDSYNNISVTISDENGNTLYVYRLSTKVDLGDTITVKGLMDTYEGTRQVAQGATAEITKKAEVSTEYKEVTIPEASAMPDSSLVIVTGVVKEIKEAWTEQYKNNSFTIVDASGNELYIFRCVTQVNLGDEVTVKGTMATYNNARQIAKDSTAEIVKAHTECVYTTLSAKCDVCGVVKEHECADAGEDKLCDACGNKIVVIVGDSLAVFTFGANGDAAHVDGEEMEEGTSFTSGDLTLTFTGFDKVYSGATDAKGNSALKVGTSKGTGSLEFEVGDNVKTVVIKVAKYKTYDTIIDVNGEEYELVGASNNGEYDTIVVDTTTVKTVALETLTGTTRCMIDSIEYFG